ncbi:MAG: hypothetical protein V4547_16285 [Bacteroidota bacterium]
MITAGDPIVYTIPEYLESCAAGWDRVDAIELLIDAMFLNMTAVIGGPTGKNVSEYWLDDGHVKIKTSYRSLAELKDGITALEQMKQRYVNRLNGRQTVLRDVNSLR